MKTCPLCDAAWPNTQATCPTDGALLIASRELDPGTVIRGKYRIQRLLGRGGMGTVYLAEHILLSRPRALKFISTELSQDPRFLKRFRHEAQAASELHHPNVVQVLDLDQAEDGSPYIAMEYVEGQDLRHALNATRIPTNGCHPDFPIDGNPDTPMNCHPERAQRVEGPAVVFDRTTKNEDVILSDPERSEGESKDPHLPFGAFPVPRALAIARGIAQGLAAAHAKGIVHRDIKPENILLTANNETPKLLDFGIAAMRETGTTITHTHGLLLTPQYAAPEQWKGLPSEDLDARADLYALGCVLYEMLTGCTPFQAHNTEGWMVQHLHTEPQPPSQLRPELANWPGLDALILRLLAKDREQRPKGVAELAGLIDAMRYVDAKVHLETVQENIAASVSLESVPTAPRSGTLKWALAAILIVALGIIWAAVRFSQPKPLTSGDGAQTEARPDTKPDYASIERQADALAEQKRYAEAAPLYDQACGGGQTHSCGELGFMYAKGQGVAKDESRAVAHFSKACDAGDPKGCAYLGAMYADGQGVAKDESRAVALYSKACDAGEGHACSYLGQCYRYGSGVGMDSEKAKQFLSKGCDLGHQRGCDWLKEMR